MESYPFFITFGVYWESYTGSIRLSQSENPVPNLGKGLSGFKANGSYWRCHYRKSCLRRISMPGPFRHSGRYRLHHCHLCPVRHDELGDLGD